MSVLMMSNTVCYCLLFAIAAADEGSETILPRVPLNFPHIVSLMWCILSELTNPNRLIDSFSALMYRIVRRRDARNLTQRNVQLIL